MSAVINRWVRENQDNGQYAGFAGFEKDLKKYSDVLGEEYEQQDISIQVALFGLVVDWLCEERDSKISPPSDAIVCRGCGGDGKTAQDVPVRCDVCGGSGMEVVAK